VDVSKRDNDAGEWADFQNARAELSQSVIVAILGVDRGYERGLVPLALQSVRCFLLLKRTSGHGEARMGALHLMQMKLIGARSLPGMVNLVGLQSPRLHLV